MKFTPSLARERHQGGVMDASNLLKPLLSSGEIRCIGSTTFTEFRGIFEKRRRTRDASKNRTSASLRLTIPAKY